MCSKYVHHTNMRTPLYMTVDFNTDDMNILSILFSLSYQPVQMKTGQNASKTSQHTRLGDQKTSKMATHKV